MATRRKKPAGKKPAKPSKPLDLTVKLRKASPHAAYHVADGVSAKEAEALGLIVVESDPHGFPLKYGKYEDATPASDE